ncbi:hypothetical protein LSH36_29g03052 [Paralvinella palmiformis]|uniref:inositol-polyphosphate 5-phosphatase n=1 Tax=Paralvinella palmiformis TaxID=53620 RepID=A0AAD9NES1_9ANNE|nr:hypothetical protein LSH36_29g03052 [Paralvinella palmiformis]
MGLICHFIQCLWDCAENLQVAVRFQLVFVCCGMFPLGVTPQSYVPGLTSAEALGSLYFIHQSLNDVQIFDFEEKLFKPVRGQEVLSGNIEHVTIKEKAKFPQEFFPNHKWSRKGFIRTRWNIHNTIFDLVNIHLFHDASNLVAMEKSPSEYSIFRKNALQYTVRRFETDEFDQVPYFLFGDFNFRMDLNSIIKSLTEKLQEHRKTGKKDELSRILYTDGDPEKVVLTVEKKFFEHLKHNDIFFNCSQWLRGFDVESGRFSDKLLEYPVTFPPSYPFSEDVEDGRSYMTTRCPAWCDRILYSHPAKCIICQDDDSPEYNMLGTNICMGDHKPIYLNVKLRHQDAGNNTTGNSSLESRDNPPTSSPSLPHKSLKKVISINGEEFEAAKLDEIDIHDYTTFEHERFIAKVIKSVRRKSPSSDMGVKTSQSSGLCSKQSFRDVVQNIMKVEHVIKVWYSHRSDTEDDSDLELDDESTDLGASIDPNDINLRHKQSTDNNNDIDECDSSSRSVTKRPGGTALDGAEPIQECSNNPEGMEQGIEGSSEPAGTNPVGARHCPCCSQQ